MRKQEFDEAEAKLIFGSTQLAETIADWSHVCTRDLLEKIGKKCDYLTQEFIDTFLQFAGFFLYPINLKLFQELSQNRFNDASERIGKIFSNTFVRVFYKETRDGLPNATDAYANEVYSFIRGLVGWYAECAMSEENKNKDMFMILVSLLSYSISQKIGLEDHEQLTENTLRAVTKVMDSKKIDELIAMMTI